MGFPGGSVVKNPPVNAETQKFNSWVGKILWRRKWQPTPVFLPGKSHGQTSLEGYSPWGRKESNMTEHAHTHTFLMPIIIWWDFPRGSLVKNLPAMLEMWVWSLGREDPLEEELATHSSILAWKIPRTEEPGRLHSIGSQKVRHDWIRTHSCS